MERKSKTIFQLDTPYTEVKWPSMSFGDQETVLELLTSLLSPIGQHRLLHTTSSRGKRSKRREGRPLGCQGMVKPVEVQAPCPPELLPYVVVGFASILRHLQSTLQRRSPQFVDTTQPKSVMTGESLEGSHIIAIFASRSSQTSVMNSHLPQLVGTASLANTSLPPTRLVQLPKGCEDKLCTSLGLPRVGVVALILNAPHSKPLLDFVYGHVPAVELGWMEEVKSAQHQALKVNFIETSTPVAKELRHKPS